MQGRLFDELRVEANQPIELRAIRQGRKGVSQMVAGLAVEVAFAGESRPPGEDGQGNDLTFREGRAGAGPLFWRTGLAEVIHYDVECGEEGVHVDHEESVPFPSGLVLGKPTLVRGHLPLKFPTDNSHQAFKREENATTSTPPMVVERGKKEEQEEPTTSLLVLAGGAEEGKDVAGAVHNAMALLEGILREAPAQGVKRVA